LILVISPLSSSAQMFSVPDRQERINRPTTIIRVGTAITNFDYSGNLDPTTGPNQLEHDNAMLALSIETLGLSANAILGNSITGIDDASFFDLNLELTNGIRIVRQRRVQAGIPFQLSTGLTTSNSDLNENRFNQTHFSGGIGGFLNLNPSRKLQIQNTALIGYGFSNSNGGFFGGTMNYNSVSSTINFLNLIGDRTLSFGYDYIFKSYDIDSEIYDYDLSGHQVTVGISF